MNLNMKSSTPSQKTRNVSADLIRIIAMLMVVVLHVAIMSDFKSADQCCYHLWVAPTIIAVNLFALLTGYLCVDKKWRVSRYWGLWMQVVFYVLLSSGISLLAGHMVKPGRFLLNLFPLGNQYWYFIAYSALFVFMPFINRGIRAMSKGELRVLCVLSVLIFSFFGFYSPSALAVNGYNVIWLTVLYLCGAYIKLYGAGDTFPCAQYIVSRCAFVKHYRWVAFCVFVLSCGMLYLVLTCGESVQQMFFWHYQSPILFIATWAFFIMLIDIPIKPGCFSRVLAFLSPMAFGVYLFTCGIWGEMEHFLRTMAQDSGFSWWFIPVYSVVIYAVGSLVDYVRMKLFVFFRIPQLGQHAASKMPLCIRRMEEW